MAIINLPYFGGDPGRVTLPYDGNRPGIANLPDRVALPDGLSDSERDREELWQSNPDFRDQSNIFGVPYVGTGDLIRGVPGAAWDAVGAVQNAPANFVTGPVWDFIRGAATGFPDAADVQPPPTLAQQGIDRLTASEMDREWSPNPNPGRQAQRVITEAELAEMVAGLQDRNAVTDNRNWWERATGAVGDFVSDFGGGAASTAGKIWNGAEWVLNPMIQAGGELLEGDLSEAIGDYMAGRFDQGRDIFGNVIQPVAGYLGQEVGQLAGDFGDNLWNNWGLGTAMGAAGQFGQSLPGMALDAAQYLGNQGLDATNWAAGQGLDAARYLGNQGLDAANWAARQGWDFTTQQAIPYFQQDFIGDVKDVYGATKDWAVDDAWGQAIEPFYENVLKPAGLDIADWAVDDVYEDVITPLYENYLKPAGLEIADFSSEELWPWMRDTAIPYIENNLGDDISDILEAVPAFVRGVAPEGSRVDDWLEGAVGGIGSAWDFGESLPGRAGDFGNRVGDYLFDPSKPAWSQGSPAQQAILEALVASAGGAGGAAAGGAGGQGGSGRSGIALPGTGNNVAGAMMPYPGAAGAVGGALAGGQPSSLDEMYAAMYDARYDAIQDQYQAGMAGADRLGQLGSDYADTIRSQGATAAADAATAANAYYTTGKDEAARAYNETIGALNEREQSLMDRFTELEIMEASGIVADAAEQRRITNDLTNLQRDRNDLSYQMKSGQLTAESARRGAQISEAGRTSASRLAMDESSLLQELSALESGRVGQEAAMAAQLATRFSGAQASTKKSIADAEKTLRDMGIEPAAYTAAPGAETQALLASQEMSMQTMQNRLRDASAAQAIDRRMRGREIYSAAGRALEDNLFALRSDLSESIAQRGDLLDVERFDARADADIAQAAALGEINLEELARLQASKESIFGKRTDLFDQGELERITTRKEYNAALERERAANRRALEQASANRVLSEAAAEERRFAAAESELDRKNALEVARLAAEAQLKEAETAREIAIAEAAIAKAQSDAEEFIMVEVNGVQIPVSRTFYTEEVIFGDAAGGGGSDENLMQMEDSEGNLFFVDVGGVTDDGVPYLTQSAATDLQLLGNALTPVYSEFSADQLNRGTAADLGLSPSLGLQAALDSGVEAADIFGAIEGNLEAARGFSDEASLEALFTKPGESKAVSDFLASLG